MNQKTRRILTKLASDPAEPAASPEANIKQVRRDLCVALKHKEPIDNLDHGKFCEALAENILGEKLNKWLKSNGFEHIASQSIKKSAKIDKVFNEMVTALEQ